MDDSSATASMTATTAAAEQQRRKRKSSAIDVAVADDEKERNDDGSGGGATTKKAHLEENGIGECVKKLIATLHRKFANVSHGNEENDDDSEFDERLRDVKIASVRVPWRTFWRDVYGSMCDSMHFFDVPSIHFHTAELRLFDTARLKTIERVVLERYSSSPESSPLSTTRRDEDVVGSNDTSRRAHHQSEEQLENDKMYKRTWTHMNKIAATYAEIIWLTLKRHTTSVPRRELCDYLKTIYERAMLGGHVLLAAPLSQFASLRIVQLLNEAMLHKLQIAIERNHGLVFNSSIAPTLIAAMQYSVIARGIRPVKLWPFANAQWPKFIRDHTALMSHYVLTGLTNDEIMLLDGEAANRRRTNYVDACKIKYESLTALYTVNDEYRGADDEETKYLATYLNLHHRFIDGDTSLLKRNIIIPKNECYSCRATVGGLGFSRPPRPSHRSGSQNRYNFFDSEEEYDDDDDDATADNAAEAVVPVQCDSISSTTNPERMDNYNDALTVANFHQAACAFVDIANGDFAIEDKNAMIDSKFLNLLILDARSTEQSALLYYQAFGLRCFPRNYSMDVHLTLLQHFYTNYTMRLVQQPLPSSLSSIVVMFV